MVTVYSLDVLLLNQSIVPCLVSTIASWPAYRFLSRQVRWSCIPISLGIFQFFVINIVKGFNTANEAETYAFLEFPCLFCNPTDIGGLNSCSSSFSKSSLYIWNFLVHIQLEPSLKDFENNLASTWNECNCTVVWTFFGIACLWDWTENYPFPVLWPLLTFPNLLAYWMQYFNSIILRIWNSSIGIPSPLLALFTVMLPKAHLTSH